MNISSILNDPELGSTVFTVQRILYTRTRSGTTSSSVNAQARGCIHPGTPEMLQLLPEEEKAEEFIAVYTDYPLSIGTPENADISTFTAPDRIHWNSRTWRVVRVRDWGSFGYYQAYAMLMHE